MEKTIALNGVLLLDKPTGITSNRAIQIVKRLFKLKKQHKVGHTGSLDPLATGMLPICFGEATKFAGFLLNADKKYLVTMQLGIKTDTADLDGCIIAKDDDIQTRNFNELQICEVLTAFIGEISQIPPIYSAIKQNGVPLYKLARLAKKKSNLLLPLPLPRIIKIYDIKLLNISNSKKQITLKVYCSKGTYIRSLIEDIAAKLNCLATVASLRRTVVGDFRSENMITIEQLEKLEKLEHAKELTKQELLTNQDQSLQQKLLQILLSTKNCLANLPVLKINQLNALSLQHGKQIYLDDLNMKFGINNLICIINSVDNALLGVAETRDNNILIAKRLVKIRNF